jgi:pyruvate formate lyase activating enzyme
MDASGALRGTVFNIQRFATADGPGIRTSVFLKGCPLTCPWCHNPEGLAPRPEVLRDAGRCMACDACLAVCPTGAVSDADRRCLACGACAEACPTGARRSVGEELSVEALLAEVIRDRLYFDRSGGGVTFTGGEPLAQPRFLEACLEALGRERIHRVVDTSGAAPADVMRRVARLADLVLFDVKLLDPERHRTIIGAPLQPILDNLGIVAEAGTPLWLRIPVIPGVSDDPERMTGIRELARELGTVERICLLPFHDMGHDKGRRLGVGPAGDDGRDPVDPRAMRDLVADLGATGVPVHIGG